MAEDKWEIVENPNLTDEQIAFMKEVGAIYERERSLVFIAKGDEWIGIGPINEKNIKQAKICADALNEKEG